MRLFSTLLQLAAVLAFTVCAGALAAYPLHTLVPGLAEVRFHKLLTLTTIAAGLVAAGLYLRLTGAVSAASIGWRSRHWVREFMPAAGAGLLLIAATETSLLLLGVHGLDAERDFAAPVLAGVLLSATLTGVGVAVVEETLFRGMLLEALRRRAGTTAAMILCSAVYASAHFLKYPPSADSGPWSWTTGLQLLPEALRRFADPATVDSWLCLFLLGLSLAVLRLRRGSLASCIGLHAGIVAGFKLAGYLTDRVPDARWAFLLNKSNPLLGWLAAAWLLVLLGFCLWKVKDVAVDHAGSR